MLPSATRCGTWLTFAAPTTMRRFEITSAIDADGRANQPSKREGKT